MWILLSNWKILNLHNQIHHDGLKHKGRYCMQRFETKKDKLKHQKKLHKPKFERGEINVDDNMIEREVGEIIEEQCKMTFTSQIPLEPTSINTNDILKNGPDLKKAIKQITNKLSETDDIPDSVEVPKGKING